jgi:hypothetical protein
MVHISPTPYSIERTYVSLIPEDFSFLMAALAMFCLFMIFFL